MKSLMALIGRMTGGSEKDEAPDRFDLRLKTVAVPPKRTTHAHPAPHLFRRQNSTTSLA